jgi:hypothetical protein
MNMQPGHIAWASILLRAHNFVCDVIALRNPSLNDDQLFNRARAVMNMVAVRLTLQDYLPHAAGINRRALASLSFDPDVYLQASCCRHRCVPSTACRLLNGLTKARTVGL